MGAIRTALFDGISTGKEADSDENEGDNCLGEYLEKISPQTEGEEVSARLAKIADPLREWSAFLRGGTHRGR